MGDNGKFFNMAGVFSSVLETIKSWISKLWLYLITVWLILVVLMLYIFRGPLKLDEMAAHIVMFVNSLTPKFYVALTGTSSLISGIILIFEWTYFKKYGSSFIEHFSLTHFSPLMRKS